MQRFDGPVRVLVPPKMQLTNPQTFVGHLLYIYHSASPESSTSLRKASWLYRILKLWLQYRFRAAKITDRKNRIIHFSKREGKQLQSCINVACRINWTEINARKKVGELVEVIRTKNTPLGGLSSNRWTWEAERGPHWKIVTKNSSSRLGI